LKAIEHTDESLPRQGENMRSSIFVMMILVFLVASSAPAQGLNKVVFGPLEGDDAGVLNVQSDTDIEVEMWVRTDPDNPTPIFAVTHGLLSDDAVIAARMGINVEPQYDMPNWEQVWLDGPYVQDFNDDYPIPEGFTCEMQGAFYTVFGGPVGDPLDTGGDWDLYGTWMMTTAPDIPIDETFYPLEMGWYPHSNQGTRWAYTNPPGGTIEPEQDYCALYFARGPCEYVPGDCDYNGLPIELNDVVAMVATYRGMTGPYFLCYCPHDPPIPDFAPNADPNGNCVENELADVVTEIGAYRGTETATGCPDCPGEGRLLIGRDKGGQKQ
jgi:hypothetical protein